ncbi:MAG: hypothetical protein LBK73_09120 [Treponema sp.]|nr:hypothetical protein [Treponema sp.]
MEIDHVWVVYHSRLKNTMAAVDFPPVPVVPSKNRRLANNKGGAVSTAR